MSTLQTTILKHPDSGTNNIQFDSSGRVGIGTASPSSPLTVNQTSGNVNLELHSSSSGRGTQIKTHNDHATFFHGLAGDTSGEFIYYTADAKDHVFSTSNSEALRIDSSTRVGIGTSTPASFLHVDSDNNYGNVVLSRNGGVAGRRPFGLGISGSTDSQLRITASSDTTGANAFANTLVAIEASGNFGLGTTPQRHLHIHESASATVGLMLTNGGTGAANDSQGFQLKVGSDTHAEVAQMENSDLRFLTNAQERLKIMVGGQLSSLCSSGIGHRIGHASTGDDDNLIQAGKNASNIANMTTTFFVKTDGDVQNSNDSYGGLSDVKLKENIVDAGSQWDDFKAVRFRKYNFKEDTGFNTFTQLGVIAQELELVSPGLVAEFSDLDDDGNDLGTTTKSVKYSILTKKALVALQEAMDRIETLEAKVAALEAG